VTDYPNIAYKTSKAGVIALTENLAITYAQYGIRVNCILPGLMNTPMAIEPRHDARRSHNEASASRTLAPAYDRLTAC
jgi:NAD(P)-dependent dehydrogenase (short-subunit alcohol dehydrogenase family)